MDVATGVHPAFSDVSGSSVWSSLASLSARHKFGKETRFVPGQAGGRHYESWKKTATFWEARPNVGQAGGP